jgi:hypothetical protein
LVGWNQEGQTGATSHAGVTVGISRPRRAGVVIAMPSKVGSVSQIQYEEIVAEARQLVLQQSRCQFAIGDLALEIEPLRDRGGAQPDPGEELFTVEEALGLFAEDIGIPVATVKTY